ncbi:Polysaccharide chain length determinant protein, PEP-CTERM locus subfamily [Azospirillaceae bacterium]
MNGLEKITNEIRHLLTPYWRWRRGGLLVAWIAAILGWLVIFILPDRYEAMTRIYVETENLLTPLLRNIAVQADVQKQLEVMQRTLLNRKNVVHVAHASDLDLKVVTEAEKEKLYEWLARQIKIKAEGHNLFTVTYADANPRLARKVVETLLNIFLETNLGLNRSGMESARNFIENQISEYEQKLKSADERMAEYKSKHSDILAATGANFAARYESVRQELFSTKAKYDDALVARAQLQASLAANPQFLDIDSAPQVMINNGNAQALMNPARARMQQLEAELTQLQSRYTARHPDVIAAKRSLEQAKRDVEQSTRQTASDKPQNGDGRRGQIPNPVHDQIKLKLIQVEGDIAQTQSRVDILAKELERLQGLGVIAPKIEAELSSLNRDYGVLKSKFEELLARRESARLSEAVEASDDKLHFRIVEPPQVPVRPSFPNRPLFNAGILIIALAMGGGFMVFLHQLDDTVTSSAQLGELFNLRVIGEVPSVHKVNTAFAQEQRQFIRSLLLLFLVFVAVLAINHFVRFDDMINNINLPAFIQRLRNHAG